LLIAKNGIFPYKVFVLLAVVVPWTLPPGGGRTSRQVGNQNFALGGEGGIGGGADSEEVYNLC